MKYAIQIDNTSRIEHSTFAKYVTSANEHKYILVDTIPTGENEKENNICNYLYIDGQYVYDPLPEPEQSEINSAPSAEERIEALEAAVTMLCMPDVSEV